MLSLNYVSMCVCAGVFFQACAIDDRSATHLYIYLVVSLSEKPTWKWPGTYVSENAQCSIRTQLVQFGMNLQPDVDCVWYKLYAFLIRIKHRWALESNADVDICCSCDFNGTRFL